MAQHDIADRTFAFSVAITRFCMALYPKLATLAITTQLLKSGTSIGANVEEAQGAQSRKDFISKMMISLKEARETRYWLRLIRSAEIHVQEPVPTMLQEAHKSCNILGAIVVNAKKNC